MSRAPQNNDDVIEGEVVESTERALMAMSVTPTATLDSSMVAILTKAELDQMVVTARANPRSVQLAMEATKEIACLTLQSATECGYALPRGRDDTTGKAKTINGPSIRLAEIVACQWGNCQAAARVTDINRQEGWVEAEGVFIDFQTNYRVTMRTRRSIRGKPKNGRPGSIFNDDMINVTSNAAQAIAFRNAVFKGVPKPIWQVAYDETQRIVRGDEKSLGARRVDLLSAFKDNLSIAPEKVYAILGVKGERDIGLDELVIAAGFYSALKNNEVTVEDLMRHVQPTATGAKGLTSAFDGAAPAQGQAQDGQKPAAGTKAAAPAKPAQETPHDPDTGEVTEPAKAEHDEVRAKAEAKVTAKDGDVIIEGPAPAGVLYHIAGLLDLDNLGKRMTFKDGASFSRATPSAGHPIYTDHPPEEAPADAEPEGEQMNSSSPASSDASPDPADLDDLPGAEEEEAEEGTADPADAFDEEEVEQPEEFTAYFESIGTKDSWLTIKAALQSLKKTDAFQGASPDLQNRARREAFAQTEALREGGKEPVNPKADPAYYAAWVDFADPAEVASTWPALIRSPAYAKLTDAQKDALADATEKAKARGS